MNRTSLALSMTLIVAAAVPAARAVDLGVQDQISDPDMLSEVQKVQEDNLDNALSRGRKDAEQSAGHLATLMAAAEAGIREALVELRAAVPETAEPEPGSLEEAADDLLLSAQMLEAKARDFRQRASTASLRLPTADPEALMGLRAGYRDRDRERDLRRARLYLKKARKKTGSVQLDEEQIAVASASQSFLGEFTNAHLVLKEMGKKLWVKRKERDGFGEAARRIEARTKRMEDDIAALSTESRLLEISFALMRHDEEAFDLVE
ncbi:MAG: hypothetical protein ABII00_15000 [Elusimicrobiota bacterium]